MAPARDLYEVLGIERDASDEDIRKAYRRLARELHPDVNAEPRSEERFKEVAGAYEILSDPEKRARYDAFGAGGPAGQPFADISDIFEMFFGQGGFGGIGSRRRGPRRKRPSAFAGTSSWSASWCATVVWATGPNREPRRSPAGRAEGPARSRACGGASSGP